MAACALLGFKNNVLLIVFIIFLKSIQGSYFTCYDFCPLHYKNVLNIYDCLITAVLTLHVQKHVNTKVHSKNIKINNK